MMKNQIERIYIPTVNRVDSQITYENLPEELRRKVVFVVQHWEKDRYSYDCEYLVLPDTEEFHYSNYFCFSNTKKLIYEHGKTVKYALIDDDIIFYRRNRKYFDFPSNMEKSKRLATEDDILEMFDLYSAWLDEPEVSVCGCSFIENPPKNVLYANNCSISSAFWINGNDFKSDLHKFNLTSVRVAQDVCFLLSLLTNGYGNRVSQEFIFKNVSNAKKTMKSVQWDSQTFENVLRDHQTIEKMFPNFFKILYDSEGKRIPGGYRNMGKVRISWNKAYSNCNKTISFDDIYDN